MFRHFYLANDNDPQNPIASNVYNYRWTMVVLEDCLFFFLFLRFGKVKDAESEIRVM